jgi:hypothetical protein
MKNDLYQPTPSEILHMRPNALRAWLTRRMAADPTLADKIAAIVGYAPRWSTLSTIQFAQVALAWASLTTASVSNKTWMIEENKVLTSIVNVVRATDDAQLRKELSR